MRSGRELVASRRPIFFRRGIDSSLPATRAKGANAMSKPKRYSLIHDLWATIRALFDAHIRESRVWQRYR